MSSLIFVYSDLEARALLNLEVNGGSDQQHSGYYKNDNNWNDETWKNKISDDANGFVRDRNETGLVYQPDALPNARPEPLDQPKSNTTLVDATIKAEIRLRRLLQAQPKIGLTLYDLESTLLKGSYFLKSYQYIHGKCNICSSLAYVRVAHYFNGLTLYFDKGQTVLNLLDVDYCEEILPTTTTTTTTTTAEYCPQKPKWYQCFWPFSTRDDCCKSDQVWVCGECRKGRMFR